MRQLELEVLAGIAQLFVMFCDLLLLFEPAVGTLGLLLEASLQRFQLALTRDKKAGVLD